MDIATTVITILLIAVGLSMDAFAVSICKGLAMKKITFGNAATVGGWFGGFQAIMPFCGFFLGILLKHVISAIVGGVGNTENAEQSSALAVTCICSAIAFVILLVIGINMLREALSKDDEPADASLAFGLMLKFAVATSIDALATGVGYGLNPSEIELFAGLDVLNITVTSLMIGITTFTLSAIGVKVGSVFGNRYEKRAEFVGGCVLIILGLKMVVECVTEVVAFF